MERIKYPRTYHLPYSKGYDGENTTIYKDFYHARSLDSRHRSYHSWLLGHIKECQYSIPEGYRICGEYLYARHSIAYMNLSSYFMVFSVWDNKNKCLSWNDTELFCKERNLITV